MNKLITILVLCTSSIITFGQQAGTLDSTFGNKGKISQDMSNPDFCTRIHYPYKLFKVHDGSILSIDLYSTIGGWIDAKITKIKQNGAIDTNFGNNGSTVLTGIANSGILIHDIYEDSEGAFIFIINNYGQTRIAKIDAMGKILTWFSYSSGKQGNDISGKTISSLFTSNHKLLIGTNYFTALLSNEGKIDTSFTCNVNNVLASFETPQGYMLFSFKNKKIIRIPIDFNGIQI